MNKGLPPVVELTRARLLVLLRESEAIFWVFVFPIVMALVLGFAFRDKAPEPIPVAVVGGAAPIDLSAALSASKAVRPVAAASAEEAYQDLRRGKVALVVEGGAAVTYRYDPTRPDSRQARLAAADAIERAAGRKDLVAGREDIVREKGSRYIDFLLPGLIGLNLMGTSMWGIGFTVLNARIHKTLKLYAATPMRRRDYLESQILARLVFVALEVPVILAVGRFVFGVPMRGSWIAFILLCFGGAMAFAGVALLTVSRSRTLEGGSGLMNFVMVPMWLASGSFFSAERFPKAVQPLIQALPLTALNNVLRSVMLDGQSPLASPGALANLAVWLAVTFAVALRIFRWQ